MPPRFSKKYAMKKISLPPTPSWRSSLPLWSRTVASGSGRLSPTQPDVSATVAGRNRLPVMQRGGCQRAITYWISRDRSAPIAFLLDRLSPSNHTQTTQLAILVPRVSGTEAFRRLERRIPEPIWRDPNLAERGRTGGSENVRIGTLCS